MFHRNSSSTGVKWAPDMIRDPRDKDVYILNSCLTFHGRFPERLLLWLRAGLSIDGAKQAEFWTSIVDSMGPRRMILKVHETFECELCTFIVWERAVLARLKLVMPIKVALQRMLAAENVSSFGQRQRGITEAMALEPETISDCSIDVRAFRVDVNIRSGVIRRVNRCLIVPRLAGSSRTPFLASAQRDQVFNDRYLPIQVSIRFGGTRWVEEGSGDASAFLKGILDWCQGRLDRREDGLVNCYLREHILHWSCRVVFGVHLCLKCSLFLLKQAINFTLDLLTLVVDRLAFCSVDKVVLFSDLIIKVLLILAQLLNASILP